MINFILITVFDDGHTVHKRTQNIINKHTINKGAKCDWDFRISNLVKNLMELIFNSCDEFRWNPEGPVSQILSSSPGCSPGIFSDVSRFVQMLNRE